VKETFADRNGGRHVVEYDEVVGFSPVPGEDVVEIHRKAIFRRFDGFKWMSPELDRQKIPQYVYEDLRKILAKKKLTSKSIQRERKGRIPFSCAILCSDSIHQGLFRTLASHSSPFVFNNTCWSWSEVSAFFLAQGARGYIGTLWNIHNDVAITGAQTFYENVFGSTILDAFHKATQAIKSSSDKDVYILWGLHFSTLSAASNYSQSRQKVFRELVRALFSWMEHARKTRSREVRANSIEIIKALREEIVSNFQPDDLENLGAELREQAKGALKSRYPSDSEAGAGTEVQRSIDYPAEFRKMS